MVLFAKLLDVMLEPVQHKLRSSLQNSMNLLALLCKHANTRTR